MTLLEALLEIEHHFGRERSFRNAPRVIDLDVLIYDDLQCHDTGLTLPHPRMHERAFVLVPLLEIAPAGRHSRAWSAPPTIWLARRARPAAPDAIPGLSTIPQAQDNGDAGKIPLHRR